MSRLPPFGKVLFNLQAEGQYPKDTVNVWIGNNAWKKGEAFSKMMPSRTLVLPPWHPPSDYVWPVKQCDILIQDTGYAEREYIEELVLCLYQGGASIVRYVAPDFTLTTFHKEQCI